MQQVVASCDQLVSCLGVLRVVKLLRLTFKPLLWVIHSPTDLQIQCVKAFNNFFSYLLTVDLFLG